jgi:hypothetical protein
MGRRGRLQHGWAQYNTTPMYEHKGYDFETPAVMSIKVAYIAPDPPPPRFDYLNIDDGHASHDNWRPYATSHSDRR